MSRSGPHSADDDRGFILIFAIGICLLLAVVGATMGRSVQSALRSTSTAVEIAKAKAIADGGVAIGLALVTESRDPEAMVCTVPGAGLIVLTVEDEGGKVSLNSDNPALLLALFTGLGTSREEAARYVSAIADYRDADNKERPNGAEAEAYAAAGFATAPKNADFETVAELDRVLGIPVALRVQAKPFLTASTSASGVDADRASDALLQILARADGFGGAVAFGGRASLPASLSSRSARTVYKVRAIGVTPAAKFVREAIIARPQEPGEPMRRMSWQQGEVTAEDDARLTRIGSAVPPC